MSLTYLLRQNVLALFKQLNLLEVLRRLRFILILLIINKIK